MGHAQWGTWALLGAFTSFYLSDQPYRARAGILAAVARGLALASAAGAATFALTAFAATYLAGLFRLPLPAGFMFILVACVSAAAPSHVPARVAFALIGGAVAWIVGMAGALVRPSAPREHAVASANAALARFVVAGPGDEAIAAEHAAAGAARSAHAAAASATGRLRTLAAGAVRLFWAAAAGEDEVPGRAAHAWSAYLRRVGDSVGRARAGHAAGRAVRAPWLDASQTSRVTPAGPRQGRSRPPWGRSATRPPYPRPTSSRHSLCTPPCARGSSSAWPPCSPTCWGARHPYWLPLTAAAVLQGHTVDMLTRRAIERVIGTIGGVLLAGGLIAVLHPSTAVAFALVVVLRAAMRALMVKNYGLAVVSMTAFALLIIHTASCAAAPGLALSRLGGTVLGVALAGAAIFLLWSRASSARLPARLAALLRAEARLARSLAGGEPTVAAARPVEAAAARLFRTAEDAMSELSPSARASRLWPAVTAATRLGYRVAAAARGLMAGLDGARPPEAVAELLDELAAMAAAPA